MNATDGKPDEGDEVDFTDEPDGKAQAAGGGVGNGVSHLPRGERPTEDRDAPGPGSTGPTTIREDLGTLADEGRKLLDAVESRFVAPLVRSYPEVARHLGAAGRELAAAVRTAVRGQEQAWRDAPGAPAADERQEKITVERVDPEKETPESGTTEN